MSEKIKQNWELAKAIIVFALLGILTLYSTYFIEYSCENDYSVIPYDECISNFYRVQLAYDESIAYLNGDFINSTHYVRRQARYSLQEELSKDDDVIKYRKMFIGGKYE